MPTINLTAEEAVELRSILENYFSELRMEIERTERADFRSNLQKREQFLKGLINRLEE